MKKFLFFFLLLICVLFSAQIKEDLKIPKNPKIGLSLAGGGAKGFAHVGVLKVLDSLGVKVDYIAGTSMGAIVGGLYASGYTGKEIEKIILDTDFYEVIANEKTRQETTFFNKSTDKYILNIPIIDGKINVLPRAISKGQKNIYLLKELFRNVSNISDFSKLPIPFMCVATNLESGNMKIFENGDLVSAIMASSAFPSLMDPVKIGDSLYIDGAMTVNYPSKPLKEKGMDIVIGVDLNQKLASRKDLNSAIAILNQVIDYGIQKETKTQYSYTDINIKPDLTGMSSTSYDQKSAILDSGYVEAKKFSPILSRLSSKDKQPLRAPNNSVFSSVYKIDGLTIVNSKIFNDDYVRGKMGLKLPSMQTYGSINKMIDKLYATNNFNLISYDIVPNGNENLLKLEVEEDNTRFFLKFGLHYDEIFKTGLLLNATAKRLLFRNAIASLDVVVGDQPRYYFNYFIDNGYIPGFGIYASGMSLQLRDKDQNIFEQRTWFRNEAFIQSVWKDRYAIGGGLSHDYFEKKNGPDAYHDFRNFINPYVFVKSDTQDDKDFPTRGIFINAEGKLIDLLGKETDEKTFQIKSKININIPLGSWLTYSSNFFAGITIGNELNSYYQYGLGGIFDQNTGNFARMEGYNLGQILSPNLLTMSNRLQVKVYKNVYVIGIFNIANHFNEINIENAVRINQSSAGITAGYKSPFGQIKLNYSKALNDNKGIFSVILGHWL